VPRNPSLRHGRNREWNPAIYRREFAVPQRIRVNTDELRNWANALQRVGQILEGTGPALIEAAHGGKDYGGQLPGRKDALAAKFEADTLGKDLNDECDFLRRLADRFDQADQEAVRGLEPPAPMPPPPDWRDWIHGHRWFWNPDTPDGTVTRPADNDFGPTQNIDLRKILETLFPFLKKWFPDMDISKWYVPPKAEGETSRHLCGVLCVFNMAGISLSEGLLAMLAAGGRFEEILRGDKYTTPQDLVELCRLLGLEPGEVTTFPAGTDIDPKIFMQVLDNGGQVMVLVNAYCPPGTVTDPAKGLYSSHWVSVNDMWYDGEETLWVEVYNPYNNQYEVYRWDTLEASMQSPGTGSPGGGYYLPVYPGGGGTAAPLSPGGESGGSNG
jgi:hypothetical protein